ncbi:hypothetical protein [Acinetobacter johnsonii]|uniref:hypothetical protein n=1 Tax=Acinetobacter johnsonii TaxID=40214 RepID=UPI0032B43E1A
MKDQIYRNYFSNLALDNLNRTTSAFFENWKYVEIIDTQFYKNENDSITAEPIVRTDGKNTHQITLQYHEKLESWSYQPNSIKNFGSTND